MNVVFIHIGIKEPDYLKYSIKQALIFNQNANIFVATNNSKTVDNRITHINIDDLEFPEHHIYFIKNNKMRKSRNGF